MTKVALHHTYISGNTVAYWKSSLPFVDNSRAKLIHRPKIVSINKLAHWEPHLGIDYWCGNLATGRHNFTFLSEPPSNKMVCQACEDKAVSAGELSSDELVGRHVHKGRIRVTQSCCPKSKVKRIV